MPNSVESFLKADAKYRSATALNQNFGTVLRLREERESAILQLKLRVMFHWAAILREDAAKIVAIPMPQGLTECACGGTGVVPSCNPDAIDGYEPCGECADGARVITEARAAEADQRNEKGFHFGGIRYACRNGITDQDAKFFNRKIWDGKHAGGGTFERGE